MRSWARRWLRIVLRRETPMERAQRAIRSARRISKSLGKRPLGNSSDDDLEVSRIGTPY